MLYFLASLILTSLIAVTHYFTANIPVITEISPDYRFDVLLFSYVLLLIGSGFGFRRA